MNTIENIKTRRSIRKYQQKEIPREIMMDDYWTADGSLLQQKMLSFGASWLLQIEQ